MIKKSITKKIEDIREKEEVRINNIRGKKRISIKERNQNNKHLPKNNQQTKLLNFKMLKK